jgi:hypothetical protein
MVPAMRSFSALFVLFLSATPALAEGPVLVLDLNRVDQVEGACRLTFVAQNDLGADLAALSVETVLIDTSGRVDRLTLFDFGALPDGVPRVRQFDIPGLACDALARVLINGVAQCSAGEACAEGLRLTSRTDVEVIG